MEYKLTRKRIKRINLYVKAPDGRVEVTAPLFTPKLVIDAFVLSKADWIRKKQAQMALSAASERPEEPISEAERAELKERIARLLPAWTERTGLKPSSWHVRSMRTRWGSCNTRTGRVNFALQLARKDDECLNYIILHELAHLRVPNHGPEFKAILDAHMSDWRRIRRKLKAQ
jgi:predicted metal-dependent hydrolase